MTLRTFAGFVPCMGSCHFLFICPTGISCLSARKLNSSFEGEGDGVRTYIYRGEKSSEPEMKSWGLRGI